MIGILSVVHAREGFLQQKSDQTLAWKADILRLRNSLQHLYERVPMAGQWTILLEFNIPRKMRRIDVVILAGDHIVLLEQKSHIPTNQDCLQVEEYGLLLHFFHQPSDRRTIVPLVVSPFQQKFEPVRQNELPFLETAAYWISPVERLSWDALSRKLESLPVCYSKTIDPDQWINGSFRPVPTIIQAALSLHSGLDVREIAHSGAARHDVNQLTEFVHRQVAEARQMKRHVICFITGVPGSGKTLVGLNLAFSKQSADEPIHFMSGNGPLVKVLQAVLSRHQMRNRVRALDAKIHAKTLIENVHVFARTYSDEDKLGAPSNHVVIFDEAQRAWNRAQNKAKFNRDYSEPEMLLSIMQRHKEWAVVIALVGGGQEINNGEAGLEEWGRSLATAPAGLWTVFASPEASDGGTSVAGSKLRCDVAPDLLIHRETQLHLDVTVRSLKADSYARWVNCVIDGDSTSAAEVHLTLDFPVFITRELGHLRTILRSNTIGLSRAGLVASSQATRLRAEGLEPDSAFHGNYPWDHWYLADSVDVRSSNQLEVFATEFEIQGLKLDWVGLCWGGDFIWSAHDKRWLIRAFRATNSRWSEVKSSDRRVYRKNSYRVLLTRARQGIVLYVPRGDQADPTRLPAEFDQTADFLMNCGARQVDANPTPVSPHPAYAANSLFENLS